jgi:hypothetical protein
VKFYVPNLCSRLIPECHCGPSIIQYLRTEIIFMSQKSEKSNTLNSKTGTIE